MNDHDVFWLARYAHNTLAPLFKEAKAIEPSIYYSIDMKFADEGSVWGQNHIEISAWWKRPGMFQQSPILRDKVDLDQFAAKLRKGITALKVAAA